MVQIFTNGAAAGRAVANAILARFRYGRRQIEDNMFIVDLDPYRIRTEEDRIKDYERYFLSGDYSIDRDMIHLGAYTFLEYDPSEDNVFLTRRMPESSDTSEVICHIDEHWDKTSVDKAYDILVKLQ